MSKPIPVVPCGQRPEVSKGVQIMLEPEYEVTHIILSASQFCAEVPPLLLGTISTSSPSIPTPNIGTQNYTSPPRVIITGAGYDDAAIEEMRKACATDNALTVPWLRADMSRQPPYKPWEKEYGEHLVGRIKTLLGELEARGGLEGDGIYHY